MIRRFLTIFEPFILMLLATVVLASVLPARGEAAVMVGYAADAAIFLLFFLHGAKLSRDAIWAGLRNWKLHLAVLGVTFVAFPALGLGLSALPFVTGPMAAGLLFLTLLPSTVQSSIAFTAIARGNVAAAVCSASFSNLLGILITPALVALLMKTSGAGGLSIDSVETIIVQLLVPFVAGHLLRPWIGAWVTRRKSILLVVYSAFGAAVVEGLWSRLSLGDLILIGLLCCALLAFVLALTLAVARAMKLPREDAIVLQFCGSKKSLASGVPMAGVLFPAAQVGVILLPLMLFHQIQLIACAVIARRYAERADLRAADVTQPA